MALQYQGKGVGKRALADSDESDDSDGASSQGDEDIPLTVKIFFCTWKKL